MNGTATDPWVWISSPPQVEKPKDVSHRISYDIQAGAKKFRIQSGVYETKAQLEAAMEHIKKTKRLKTLTIVKTNSKKNGYRFRTGMYATKALALAAAENALRAGDIGWAHILGE